MKAYLKTLNAAAEAVRQAPKLSKDAKNERRHGHKIDQWWDALPNACKAKLWSLDEITHTTGIVSWQLAAMLTARRWQRVNRKRGNQNFFRLWMPPVKSATPEALAAVWLDNYKATHPSLAAQMKAVGMVIPRPRRRFNNAVKRGEVAGVKREGASLCEMFGAA